LNNYLIKLALTIDGYEKHTHKLVKATDESDAILSALKAESHGECGFNAHNDWIDCGSMIYAVESVKELNEATYDLLQIYL
jgi:hypothetical protein